MLIGVIPGAGTFYLNHVPGTPRYYLIPGPGHPPSKPPDRQLVVSTHAQKKRPVSECLRGSKPPSVTREPAGGRTDCRAASWDGKTFVRQTRESSRGGGKGMNLRKTVWNLQTKSGSRYRWRCWGSPWRCWQALPPPCLRPPPARTCSMPTVPGGFPGTPCPRLQCQVGFVYSVWRSRVSLVRQIGFFLSVFSKSKRKKGEVDQKCAQEICPIFHRCQSPLIPHCTHCDIKVSGGDLNLILKHASALHSRLFLRADTYSKPTLSIKPGS